MNPPSLSVAVVTEPAPRTAAAGGVRVTVLDRPMVQVWLVRSATTV
jgi:hypothetical protein